MVRSGINRGQTKFKGTAASVCINECVLKDLQALRGPLTARTTHRGAGLCGERMAIVTAVTGQAAIVQLPLWDWLKQAGPPCDLKTQTHTRTHTVQGISSMLSHGDLIPDPSAGTGRAT